MSLVTFCKNETMLVKYVNWNMYAGTYIYICTCRYHMQTPYVTHTVAQWHLRLTLRNVDRKTLNKFDSDYKL